MSNKERVLAYLKERAGKREDDPINGCRIDHYHSGLKVVVDRWWIRLMGKNVYSVGTRSPAETFETAARILGLTDKPAAAEPSKIDDQWKMYAQQLRKELTDTQQDLTDQKAAYNGLCEAHKELVDRLSGPNIVTNPEIAQSLGKKRVEILDILNEDSVKEYGSKVIKAMLNARPKEENGQVPE